MKRLVILLFILIHIQVHCQIKKERPVFWVIPSIHTKIDGLAVGLIINSMKVSDSTLTTIVNGLSLELIGVC
jgi:hypothetical protein